MEYTNITIAPFQEGKRDDVESWLLPNEAFADLENVFFRRGIMQKRFGYSLFGQMGTLVSATAMTKDGVTERYTVTVGAGVRPVIPHSFIATTNTGKIAYDDGAGKIIGDVLAAGTNTISYSSGVVDLTFTAVASASCTYDHHYSDTGADRTVRGLFNLENLASTDVGIACDRDNVAVFDTTYKYFENKPLYVSGTYSYFGDRSAQMWGASFNDKQYMCDGVGADGSGIWIYDPSLGSDGAVMQRKFAVGAGTARAAVAVDTGDGGKEYNGTLTNLPIIEGSLTTADAITQEGFTDNGDGTLTGDAGGSGTVNYVTGKVTLSYNANLAGATAITAGYDTNDVSCDYAQMIFPYYSRLVCFRTKETADAGSSHTTYDQRGRWGKINSDFRWKADVGGQGSSIDAATNETILSAGLIKGVIVVAFERSIWLFESTGNASIPFRWRRLAGNLEINTIFGTFVTEGMVYFVGHGGIYGCDGVRVERIDTKIPDFTDENISLTYINNCSAAYDNKLNQGLLTYTSVGSTTDENDYTLVFGLDEGWFSRYDWGMRCLGNYVKVGGTTWTDLIAIGSTWGSSGILGQTWKALYQQDKEDLVLGGSDKGYVYAVNDTSKTTDEFEGTDKNYNFKVMSKRYNPFIANGEQASLGYIDILCDKTAYAAIKVRLYHDESEGYYAEKKLTMQSTRSSRKIWKRTLVRNTANQHAFELIMDGSQVSSDNIGASSFRIHAFKLGMRQAGKTWLS